MGDSVERLVRAWTWIGGGGVRSRRKIFIKSILSVAAFYGSDFYFEVLLPSKSSGFATRQGTRTNFSSSKLISPSLRRAVVYDVNPVERPALLSFRPKRSRDFQKR